MRGMRELVAQAARDAVCFTKSALTHEEREYLTELPSLVLQTEEFIIMRNPLLGPIRIPPM